MRDKVGGEKVDGRAQGEEGPEGRARNLAPDQPPDANEGFGGSSRMEDQSQGGEYVDDQPRPTVSASAAAEDGEADEEQEEAPAGRGNDLDDDG